MLIIGEVALHLQQWRQYHRLRIPSLNIPTTSFLSLHPFMAQNSPPLITSDDESKTYVLLETKGEDCVLYTRDETVDYLNSPANKLKTGNWKACFFVVATAIQHSATASRNLSNWTGACYIAPLFGAFVADGYIGKYWTIATSSILYAIGMTLLTLSATMPQLMPTCSKTNICDATKAETIVCFTALCLVAIASGGIKACVSAYGAQINLMIMTRLKKSSRVLFLIAMGMSVFCFFSGTWFYRKHKPKGSPFTRFFQVVVASFRKKRINIPPDSSLLYEIHDHANSTTKLNHTRNFRFLDKAAVKLPHGSHKRINEPMESLHSIIFSTIRGQIDNLFILQCLFMDTQIPNTSFKIPPASIGTGHFISIFSMSTAGILELVRLDIVRRHNYYETKPVPVSIFWQVPQFLIIGCAEVFTLVGQMEFFNEEVPDSMSSLGSAMRLMTIALGSYFSSLLVSVVIKVTTEGGGPGWIPDTLNYGELHKFFWLLGGLNVVNLGVFVVVAKWHTSKNSYIVRM
ncbi:unnamed protein product [Lactuca saligna]|uniref:Uncharacterized protein n=1 Tax=Lactuca saligna TaxID=75948 RepID=A0AA36EIF5_LACSI|nr:unnamed protein product [Lactuca saligna]